MVAKDATAVSVQMQSGMELDISRKHAAPKPNPPDVGPTHCKWQIMGGIVFCECHVRMSQIYHLALFASYGIMFDFEANASGSARRIEDRHPRNLTRDKMMFLPRHQHAGYER